jgi:hypothetical protein
VNVDERATTLGAGDREGRLVSASAGRTAPGGDPVILVAVERFQVGANARGALHKMRLPRGADDVRARGAFVAVFVEDRHLDGVAGQCRAADDHLLHAPTARREPDHLRDRDRAGIAGELRVDRVAVLLNPGVLRVEPLNVDLEPVVADDVAHTEVVTGGQGDRPGAACRVRKRDARRGKGGIAQRVDADLDSRAVGGACQRDRGDVACGAQSRCEGSDVSGHG